MKNNFDYSSLEYRQAYSKLQDLLNMGYIDESEFEERLKMLVKKLKDINSIDKE